MSVNQSLPCRKVEGVLIEVVKILVYGFAHTGARREAVIVYDQYASRTQPRIKKLAACESRGKDVDIDVNQAEAVLIPARRQTIWKQAGVKMNIVENLQQVRNRLGGGVRKVPRPMKVDAVFSSRHSAKGIKQVNLLSAVFKGICHKQSGTAFVNTDLDCITGDIAGLTGKLIKNAKAIFTKKCKSPDLISKVAKPWNCFAIVQRAGCGIVEMSSFLKAEFFQETTYSRIVAPCSHGNMGGFFSQFKQIVRGINRVTFQGLTLLCRVAIDKTVNVRRGWALG